MQICRLTMLLTLATASVVLAQSESRGAKPVRAALVKMPYVGERNTARRPTS